MRNLIKALPVAVVLPLALFLASVGPNDAAANISKWMSFLGVHDLSAWRITPYDVAHINFAAFFLSVVYIVAMWGWRVLPRLTKGRRSEEARSADRRTPNAATPQAAIVWDTHLGHTYSGLSPNIRTHALQIKGKNVSGRAVEVTKLKLTSGVTGAEKPVSVLTADGLLPVSEINEVPSGASIVLKWEFDSQKGIDPQDLLNQWGEMRISITYDGERHNLTLTEDMVRAVYSNFQPSPIGPRVTRRLESPPQ